MDIWPHSYPCQRVWAATVRLRTGEPATPLTICNALQSRLCNFSAQHSKAASGGRDTVELSLREWALESWPWSLPGQHGRIAFDGIKVGKLALSITSFITLESNPWSLTEQQSRAGLCCIGLGKQILVAGELVSWPHPLPGKFRWAD